MGHLRQPAPFPFEAKQYRGAAVPTTATSAIRKWIAPMLQRRPELTLVDRRIVLKPTGHLVRGIHFDVSPTGVQLRPRWFINVAYSVPVNAPYHLARRIIQLESTSENFERHLEWHCEHVVDTRLKSTDLGELLEGMEAGVYDNADATQFIHDASEFRRATTLATLGRFDEAAKYLRDLLPKRRTRYEKMLKIDRKLLTKMPSSEMGQYGLNVATADLAVVAEMERLLACLEAADREGVVGLLHEWERTNMKAWGVEHLWEPTAFPLELGTLS